MPQEGEEMRIIVFSGIFILGIFFLLTAAPEAPISNVDNIVIPSQFHDNEDIFIYLTGNHEKACTQINNVEQERYRGKIIIKPTVKVAATCSDSDLNFEQPVRLHEVPYGPQELVVVRANGEALHQVFDRNKGDVYKPILNENVTLLAPSEIEEGQAATITIKGFFPNGCYKRDYMEVYVVDDIIMVYPNAVKYVRADLCTMSVIPYEEKIEIQNLKAGRYNFWVMDEDKHYMIDKVMDVRRAE